MSASEASQVRVSAPAKINWSLEVLGKRPDGYHEIRTVLQAVALSDRVTLTPADGLLLELGGDAAALAAEPPKANLAYRAALRLKERASSELGARIALEKNVPVAAGLGGGSSDAAAVLRGLNALWELGLSTDALGALAAELGSDVPFFLQGGAALGSGRGEVLQSLPDASRQSIVLAWPRTSVSGEKTARMYAALRPEHYSDGSRTEGLAKRMRAGEAIRDEDVHNVFEALMTNVDPEAAEKFRQAAELDFGPPHLCGSGPAIFFFLEPGRSGAPLLSALDRIDLRAVETHTLTAAESTESSWPS